MNDTRDWRFDVPPQKPLAAHGSYVREGKGAVRYAIDALGYAYISDEGSELKRVSFATLAYVVQSDGKPLLVKRLEEAQRSTGAAFEQVDRTERAADSNATEL